MTIKEMVYTFQLKADKIDSKTAANLKLAPTIYLLNEGMLSLIKQRYNGLNPATYRKAVEEIQKRKDEFQRILVPDEYIKAKKVDNELYTVDLTEAKYEYMFLMRTNFYAKKGRCERRMKGILTETDDLDITENSDLLKSSFEWGEAIFRLAQDKLRVVTDSTFSIQRGRIDYLRYPVQMDMAGYEHFSGSASANIDCELPRFMHPDIVDEAVLIYSISLMNPDLQAKMAKLSRNE